MQSSYILSILAIFNLKKKKIQKFQVHQRDQKGLIENLFEMHHWCEREEK